MTGSGEAFRLELDGTKCDGHGICMLCCPTRIGLDAWGYAVVNSEDSIGGRELVQARRAVAACPEDALRLVSRRADPSRSRPVVALQGPRRRGRTTRWWRMKGWR